MSTGLLERVWCTGQITFRREKVGKGGDGTWLIWGKKGSREKPQSLWLSGKHENDERILEEKKQESMRKPSTEPRALSKEGPLV